MKIGYFMQMFNSSTNHTRAETNGHRHMEKDHHPKRPTAHIGHMIQQKQSPINTSRRLQVNFFFIAQCNLSS